MTTKPESGVPPKKATAPPGSGAHVARIGCREHSESHTPMLDRRPPTDNFTTGVKPRRGILRWLIAVGESSMDSGEKNICRVMLRWIDHQSGGRAWPSVETIARDSSMTRRGVQNVLNRLQSRGVLHIENESRGGVGPHGRGNTHRYRMDLNAIEALRQTKNCARQAPELRTAASISANGHASNCAPSAHNPTITTPFDSTNVNNHAPDHAVELREGWVDGMANTEPLESLRSLLAACGIAGPYLEEFARLPGLTAAEVRQEWDSICQDRAVKNRQAVLVKRLRDRYGVQRPSRSSISGDLAAASARINRLRKTHGGWLQ